MFTCSVSTNVCCNLPLRLRFCLFLLSSVSICFIHFDAVFFAGSFRTAIETIINVLSLVVFLPFEVCFVRYITFFWLVWVGGWDLYFFYLFTVSLSISFYLRCIF